MNVTRAITTRDVFHLPDTFCVSHKKNTVAAIIAMEINQKETPTMSSGCKLAAANVVDGKTEMRPTGVKPVINYDNVIVAAWALEH